MFARLAQDSAHRIETVGAPCVGQFRLRRIFRRERRNRLGVDIRGIGENEIVPAAAETSEQVRANEGDTILEAVVANVDLGNGQGISRYFARIDLCCIEPQRRQNGQTARPRAQVQDRLNVRRLLRYAVEIAGQQLSDI